MDTDSWVFSLTSIKGLINNLKHFSEGLDLGEKDPTYELYLKGARTAIRKMKPDSSPDNELDEKVYFKCTPLYDEKLIEFS